MAKHPGKCPKCGSRLEFDTAVDERVLCPACQAMLSLPGKAKPSDKVDPLLGERLGEFEIVELLGRGGMGAVYKARQASLDRFVAVKVLPRLFSRDASFVERFAREARDAAAVIHPHIIQVYAVGEDRGYQFIAMELVDGVSLADVLRREGPLSPERVLAVMKQVAGALAVAHAAGIVHRDIKPSNILLTSRGEAKVADFGLAKRPGVDASVTLSGATLGTPLYFPPEIARGQQADPRSDLYSLGAAFYHLLAGRPPFEGGSAAELALKHAETRVPPLRDVAPAAPPDLCRVIHRLLRKSPGDRHQSAEALLEALERVETHVSVSQFEPTRTLPDTAHRSLAERREARQRRRRILLAATIGAAALIALAVALVLVLVLGQKGKPPPAALTPPTSPAPGTRHPEPAPAAPRLERNAEILFNNARTCAERKDWDKALGYLDRLDGTYGETQFRADHVSDIAALRAKVEAALKPGPSGWEAAWTAADAEARKLVAGQRFGEAVAGYNALVDRFHDLALRQRVDEAVAAVRKQADAACRALETSAREKIAEAEFADARAALGPALDRYGLPDKVQWARTLLAEIDAAEQKHKDDQAQAEGDAARRAEEQRRAAERERRRQAEQRYAQALKPIDQLIAAWQFGQAAEALGKLDLPEEHLAARLATRRDEAQRLATLKAKLIARVNTSKPPLRKSSLLIPGINGELVKADEAGITARLSAKKTELHQWPDLDQRSVARLVSLAIGADSADDCLAAGILSLALQDPATAEKHFEKARKLGAAIDRYLDPLAAASFARAEALLGKKDFRAADTALADLETRYSKTPWFASHKQDIESARQQAKAAIAEAEAEKLYARAAELFKQQQFFDLKPLIEKLEADYPKARLLTDAARKPTFADMAAAVGTLGKFLTVRKDGKGDFTSIQAAIDAAPPNSVVEIQDNGLYNEPIVIHKQGIALRGKKGRWPVITSWGRRGGAKVLVEVGAPRAAMSRLALAHAAPLADRPSTCLLVRAAAFQLRSSILYAGHPEFGIERLVFRSTGRSADAAVQDCVLIGKGAIYTRTVVSNSLWLRGTTLISLCSNECELRSCTIDGTLSFSAGGPVAVLDCIVSAVTGGGLGSRKQRIEGCDLFGSSYGFAKRCFSADPQFRDPKNFDYRLKPSSPCRKRASDGGDIGCRFTPEMLEMLKLAHELRKKGIIKF